MSNSEISFLQCANESYCCLPPRATVFMISIINLCACLMDLLFSDSPCQYCQMCRHVSNLRMALVFVFQMANLLLLLGIVVENQYFLQIYLWYTLGYIVMALVATLMDFVFMWRNKGFWSFISFVPDVIYLFVLFRCLPLVEEYRRLIMQDETIVPGKRT